MMWITSDQMARLTTPWNECLGDRDLNMTVRDWCRNSGVEVPIIKVNREYHRTVAFSRYYLVFKDERHALAFKLKWL